MKIQAIVPFRKDRTFTFAGASVAAFLLAGNLLAAAPAQAFFGFNPAEDNYTEDYVPDATVPRVPPQIVAFDPHVAPGTIVVDTEARRLYFVTARGEAIEYMAGVGREGFEWKGTQRITRKAEWPDWRPPAQMLKRRPDLPLHMAGGLDNPLGARALYLGRTLYRIHGTNEPDSLGAAVSSGCIRLHNDDVIDLYERVSIGTAVIVR